MSDEQLSDEGVIDRIAGFSAGRHAPESRTDTEAAIARGAARARNRRLAVAGGAVVVLAAAGTTAALGATGQHAPVATAPRIHPSNSVRSLTQGPPLTARELSGSWRATTVLGVGVRSWRAIDGSPLTLRVQAGSATTGRWQVNNDCGPPTRASFVLGRDSFRATQPRYTAQSCPLMKTRVPSLSAAIASSTHAVLAGKHGDELVFTDKAGRVTARLQRPHGGAVGDRAR